MKPYKSAGTTPLLQALGPHLDQELGELLLPAVHGPGGSPFLPQDICRER